MIRRVNQPSFPLPFLIHNPEQLGMPTQTFFLGGQAINLGPVTSTFTAPASCSTSRYTEVWQMRSGNALFRGNPTCTEVLLDGCVPNGKEWDAAVSARRTRPGLNMLAYNSPGLYCPSGWTTAGTIVGDGRTGTSGSGFFTSKSPDLVDGGAGFASMQELYARLLDPGETLALCCPEGYVANAHGDCFSLLGPGTSYGYSEVCAKVIPSTDIRTGTDRQGGTGTKQFLFVTDVDAHFSTETMPLPTAESTSLSVYAAIPPVVLVHKASETSGGSQASSTGGVQPTSGEKKNVSARAFPGTLHAVLAALIAMSVGALLA